MDIVGTRQANFLGLSIPGVGSWKIKELEKTDACASSFSNTSTVPPRP